MESPRQLTPTINDMLMLSTSSSSSVRPVFNLQNQKTQHPNQQNDQTESVTRSPTNSSPTTNIDTPPPSTDENLVLAAQLASTVPVVDEKEERPSLSYKDLIIEAIESSPEKRLKLSEIYQVIKYLHPYYKQKSDSWGWQNSIRHNLSLHDCFVKLPLKQTSASGVVGHFWTVVRESEEKQNSSRRRSRNNNNPTGARLTRCSSGKVASSHLKGKGRQSVSSDSGVMSDESQANSPTIVMLSDGTTVRKDTLTGISTLTAVASAPQLHRPVPSYINDLQKQESVEQPSLTRHNLLNAINLGSLLNTPPMSAPASNTPDSLLGAYGDLTQSMLMSSALLRVATQNSTQLNSPTISIPSTINESPPLGLNDHFDPMQRLQLLNSSLYQNNSLVQQVMDQAQLFEQQQQSTNIFLNQLLTLKAQLAKPATSLFLPQQLPATNGLQQHLIQLLSQQLLNSSNSMNNQSSDNNAMNHEREPTDSTTAKEDMDLIV